MYPEIELRILKTSDEMMQVQDLEYLIWKMDPVPVHQTITAAQNGGIVLGAFLNKKLIGFSYGFAGFNKVKGYLCSHMLGIHPEHQDKGIGAKLKQKQKEVASEMGYDLVTWTFDPLESRNAYLNLSKLNAICSIYVENCYGEMEDSLNQGLPSDRLKVEWWINSPHVIEAFKTDMEQAQSPFKWEITDDGFPALVGAEQEIQGIQNRNPILVPVPANIQAIKSNNPQLALNWRMKTREIFQSLFKQGYAAVSILKEEEELIHKYVLVPREQLKVND
jgi:predicted GNAT superfamily acetyltransferase